MPRRATIGAIPESVLIPAANATIRHFKKAADSWKETERCYCRELCGPEYAHIESDVVGLEANRLRKTKKLKRLNDKMARKPRREPDGWYAEYRAGDHWQSFRLEVLEFWNYRCCLCPNTKKLEVHHNCYDRRGHERLTDCVVLCETCHRRIHHRLPDWDDVDTEPDDLPLFP